MKKVVNKKKFNFHLEKNYSNKRSRIKSTKGKDNLTRIKINVSPIKQKKNNLFENRKNSLKEKNNKMYRCIFSNVELKKYINDEDNQNNKSNINNSLNNSRNIVSEQISFSEDCRNKKVIKEDSSTSHENNHIFERNFYITTPKIWSIGSFKTKNNFFKSENKKFKLLKKSKRDNYLNIKEKININKEKDRDKNNNTIDNNKSNNFFTKSKYVNDVIIDNHIIKSNEEPNKKYSKFYIDAYNYHIMQSIIQDRSNYFTIKNLNYFPFQYYRLNNNRYTLNDRNDVNLNYYFTNVNNNFSLRELYRNMNNENYLLLSPFKKNKDKTSVKKKKKKKSVELKLAKQKENKDNNLSKKKFNLANVQYDLDKYKENKNNLDIEKTVLRKKSEKINLYNNNKDLFLQYFTNRRAIGKLYDNLYGRKNKNNIKEDNDILETGLTNSSSQIKINGNKGLNKFYENKNNCSKRNLISKKTFNKGNKKIKININDDYKYNNNYCNILSIIKNIK